MDNEIIEYSEYIYEEEEQDQDRQVTLRQTLDSFSELFSGQTRLSVTKD